MYLHQVKRNGNSTADERTGSGPGRAADERTGKTTRTGTIEKGAHRTFTLDFENFIHGQFTHNRSPEIGTRPVCMGWLSQRHAVSSNAAVIVRTQFP